MTRIYVKISNDKLSGAECWEGTKATTSRRSTRKMKKTHVSAMGFIFLLLTVLVDLTSAGWWQLPIIPFYSTHGGLHSESSQKLARNQLCHSYENSSFDVRRLCSISNKAIEIVVRGARIGLEECQYQFRHSRWNCTATPNSTSLYGEVPLTKSRETAYIHAINAAALAWSMTQACSKGELTECGCDNTKRKRKKKWQWGGCSDDINFGVQFSRRFIDSEEDNTTETGLMNLHNNEAGRRALRSRMHLMCKCHGMSGSCTTKVCWKRMPSMRVVSEALGQLYDGASHVKFISRGAKPPKLKPKELDHKKIMKTGLVYLEESSDYCERNEELGILGTHGRVCNRTSPGIDGCRLLCCGRGYQTRVRHVEEKCNCQFVWCCKVKCDMCNHTREEHICN
ncbi:protein Wnt-1-like [Phlebotomus papatasi]|uniref:protein Wnt-1-like n=1 Tax=Phlebotomus papatasi TaxID=29031 RepID=UPI0024845F19|nr:protein Wnt-1-like [Phlebotomus papatasi]